MKVNDVNIQKRVVSFLTEKYGFKVKETNFIPVGEESFAYKIVANDGQAYFVKYCQTGDAIENLRQVHELLFQIRDLDFVVAPTIAFKETEFEVGKGQVCIFPYIEGKLIEIANEPFEEELVAKITDMMAQIHKLAGKVKVTLPIEKFDDRYRARLKLERLKVQIEKAGNQLRNLFEENEAIIERVIEVQASEANIHRQRKIDFVLTHGDITGRNMIQTVSGLKLVDWDGAMLAPAERDIIFFYDHPNFSLDRYYEQIGKDKALFDRRLMEYYGRQWAIESILENFEKLLAGVPDNIQQEYLDEISEYVGYYKS